MAPGNHKAIRNFLNVKRKRASTLIIPFRSSKMAALKSTVSNKALIAVTSQDQSHFTTATKDLYSYLSQRENEFVDVENGKELSQLVYPDKPILYREDLTVHHQHPSLRDITSLIQIPTPPWPYPYLKGANTNVEVLLDTIAKRGIL
jgi:hypothetical protein